MQSRLRGTQEELLNEEEDEIIEINDEIDLSGEHHENGDEEEGVFIDGDIFATWDAISQLYSPEYALELGLHPPFVEENDLMSSATIEDAFESKEEMVQSLETSNSTQQQEISTTMTTTLDGQEAPLNPDSPAPYPEGEDLNNVSFYWTDSFNENMELYKFHVHVLKEEYTQA